MRTLHNYLTKQIILTLVMTVAVFTFILLLGGREILSLLVNRQANLGTVLQAVGLLIPNVMVFALPMGMVTAALLVFGRFSADQELTAVRASGVSLLALVTPILLFSIAVCGLCAFMNMEIAPRCKIAFRKLLFRIGTENPASFLVEDRFITEIPGYIIYVRKLKGNHLGDVWFYELKDNEIVARVNAEEGTFSIDAATRTVHLNLTNAVVEMRQRYTPPPPEPSPPDPNSESNLVNGLSLDTTNQTAATSLEANTITIPANTITDTTNTTDTAPAWVWRGGGQTGVYEQDIQFGASKTTEPKLKLSEMTFQQLRNEIRQLEARGADATPARSELHRQIAFSFASLGFTLIGIPLGIRAHRRETSIGVALALVLVLLYYSFFILGQSLESHPEMRPYLIFWVPNFLFEAVGAALLWRANRIG